MSLKLENFISSGFFLMSGVMCRVGRGITGSKLLKVKSIRIEVNSMLPIKVFVCLFMLVELC